MWEDVEAIRRGERVDVPDNDVELFVLVTAPLRAADEVMARFMAISLWAQARTRRFLGLDALPRRRPSLALNGAMVEAFGGLLSRGQAGDVRVLRSQVLLVAADCLSAPSDVLTSLRDTYTEAQFQYDDTDEQIPATEDYPPFYNAPPTPSIEAFIERISQVRGGVMNAPWAETSKARAELIAEFGGHWNPHWWEGRDADALRALLTELTRAADDDLSDRDWERRVRKVRPLNGAQSQRVALIAGDIIGEYLWTRWFNPIAPPTVVTVDWRVGTYLRHLGAGNDATVGKVLQQLASDDNRDPYAVLSDPSARTRPAAGRDLARAVVLVGAPISAAVGALWMAISIGVGLLIASGPDTLGVIVGVWLSPVAAWLSCAGSAVPLSSQRLRVRLRLWSAWALAVVLGLMFFAGGAVVVLAFHDKLSDTAEWLTVVALFALGAVFLNVIQLLESRKLRFGPPAPEQFISALKPAPELYADLDHGAEGLLALAGRARDASRRR